jgi:F-type H+-transporting ATPase subunit b
VARGGALAGVVLSPATALAAEAAHGAAHAPSITELLFPGANFVLFVSLLWWAGAGIVRSYLRDKRAAIVGALEHAACVKRDAERDHAEARALLARADAEAEGLRRDLRTAAELEQQRRRALAEASVARMKSDARIVAEQEVRTARAALREETVKAAVAETLAVLRRQIKGPDQERFIGEFVAEVGRRR